MDICLNPFKYFGRLFLLYVMWSDGSNAAKVFERAQRDMDPSPDQVGQQGATYCHRIPFDFMS